MSYCHLSHRVKRSQDWSQDWSLSHRSWRSSLLSEHISGVKQSHTKAHSVLASGDWTRNYWSSLSLHLWSSNQNLPALVSGQTKNHGYHTAGVELSSWHSSWSGSDSSVSSASFRHSLHEHWIFRTCNVRNNFGHLFSQEQSTSNST